MRDIEKLCERVREGESSRDKKKATAEKKEREKKKEGPKRQCA